MRLVGDVTRNFKDSHLGQRNGWSWQGGRFNGLPPHWKWGVERNVPGGLDAAVLLVARLFRESRIDKVIINNALEHALEASLKRF